MSEEIVTWLGGGIALVLTYIVISNTLWLLFGSKLLQSLPGVNIRGSRGTLKIATMLALAAFGVLRWTLKYAVGIVAIRDELPVLSEEVSRAIKQGARLVKNESDSHPLQ